MMKMPKPSSNPVIDRSRRNTLKALTIAGAATAVPGLLHAQIGAVPIRLKKIHCCEIRVSDVDRSVKFYQDLFGMQVLSVFGGRTCLQVGDSEQFVAVRGLEAGESPAITMLGLSVQNYDQEYLISGLEQSGFERILPPQISQPGIANAMSYWIRDREGTPELYFSDARGLIMQLVDSRYCGGRGPLGSECVAGEPVAPGLFELSEINHFTTFVNDGTGANTFYQNTFGMKPQAYQAATPANGVGDGFQFLMFAGPFPGGESSPANIHHGSFNMHGFDEQGILDALTEYGLEAQGDRQLGPMMHYVSRRMPERGGAPGGTPEVYFTDPDGLLMQVQDVSYCGGGGYLGSECLDPA